LMKAKSIACLTSPEASVKEYTGPPGPTAGLDWVQLAWFTSPTMYSAGVRLRKA
jgi:hypothetical protein